MVFQVDVDDFDYCVVVDGNYLIGYFDVMFGQFGDVYQVFDIFFDVDECIEWN